MDLRQGVHLLLRREFHQIRRGTEPERHHLKSGIYQPANLERRNLPLLTRPHQDPRSIRPTADRGFFRILRVEPNLLSVYPCGARSL